MSELRDRVAGELEALLQASGLDEPWSDRKDASTRWLHSDGALYDVERLRFHEQLVGDQRALQSVSANGSLAAVVTAGPPGAGKSTALAGDERLASFRSVDADSFKDPLLADARQHGHLDQWLSRSLLDGHPIAARELAGFVHAESTAVADAMRDTSLDLGEDIVIHGTLSSREYVEELLAELDDFGYERLIIYDVEVPVEQAVEQALQRWWTVRESRADPLGSRFVPASHIRTYYSAGERAVTESNAAALRDRAEDLGWSVELNVVSP